MNFLIRLKEFFDKHNRVIIIGLCLLCLVQTCTISSLRYEVEALRSAPTLPVLGADSTAAVRDTVVVRDTTLVETPVGAVAEEDKGGGLPLWIALVALLAAVGVFLYQKSIFPFTANLRGKLWQDLQGNCVYSLTVRNRGKVSVAIDDATIMFSNGGDKKRKFKMPVADFPLTLTKGTSHTVNISLQKLIIAHPELMDYRMIVVMVTANGSTRTTFPAFVKWKK